MKCKRETVVNLGKYIIFFVIIGLSAFIVKILFFNQVKTQFELQQVLILSRHNARTPTSKNLAKISPQSWPQWEELPGHLTKKGFLLEGYMGIFFSSLLFHEKLLQACPSNDEFFVYANSMERTLSSAKAFLKTGFPDCNITIHHTNVNESDPVFSPYIHNSTNIFKEIALKEMYNVLNELNLNSSYIKMEDILNYKQSEFCKVEKECDMTLGQNKAEIIIGKKPHLSGPLKTSNEAVDTFLMEYYNGLDMDNVAWGKLKTEKDWDSILELSSSYHNVAYNTTHVAQDLAMPLLKYICNVILNKNHKVILLMGHDANINVLLHLLSIKPFVLTDSLVKTPIGGKIVFQKWLYDNKYFLKINYVYQSTKQLREGIRLSLDNPPSIKLLELNSCKTNEDGYCPWDDFIAFLNTLIK